MAVKAGTGTTKTCLRCGWTWESALNRPRVCARCKSYRWDTSLKKEETR